MSFAPTTDAERADIARNFAASGMTQRAYAIQHGISDRTLREWLRRYSPVPSGDAHTEARRVIEQAIHRLQRLLGDLDAGRNLRAVDDSTVQNPMPPGLPGALVFLSR